MRGALMGPRSTIRARFGLSRASLSFGSAVLGLVLTAAVASAQTVPPGAVEQLDHLIGSRVETFAVLDTQSGVAGGTYASKVNDTDLAITRVTGRGDVTGKHPLGDTGILWSVVVEGGIGYGTFENNFDDGALAGNRSTVTSIAVFGGTGVRFTVWEDLSLAPTVGLIYAHTDNDFEARNDVGRNIVQLAGSGAVNDVVNWSADTITVVPGIELRYRHLFGSVQLTLKSLFKYFHTEPIERSTTALSFESSSQWWFNEIDVEWRMPVYLWGRQLRTGAYFARSDLFGGLEESFGTDHFYQAGGRLVMDVQGLLWKLEYIGLGAGYFWSDRFSGWTIGAEVSFAF
jgi:solitary outer membrane autotransporter-like beta-barrel protein